MHLIRRERHEIGVLVALVGDGQAQRLVERSLGPQVPDIQDRGQVREQLSRLGGHERKLPTATTG